MIMHKRHGMPLIRTADFKSAVGKNLRYSSQYELWHRFPLTNGERLRQQGCILPQEALLEYLLDLDPATCTRVCRN